MLSLLITVIVLFAALLAALRLRSVVAGLVGLVLAALAFTALVKRPLDGAALPSLHVVCAIDEAHPVLPGPNLPDRTADTVSSRLQRMGLNGSKVRAVPSTGDSPGTTLDIVAPFGPGDRERLVAALAVVGLLELVEIDDDAKFFETMADDIDAGKVGVRFEMENVPLGPGRTDNRSFAFMPRREGESIAETRRRFEVWTATLRVPENRRIAFEKVVRLDPDGSTWEEEGWRTFFLHREAMLTNSHIVVAQARPDTNQSLGGWLVAIEFTAAGGRLFEEETARLVRRRFAIALDGIVESAPVIQTRIAGGQGVITMGAGSPEEQAEKAKQLELVLRSGALPAPLTLLSEDRIEPTISPGAFRALLAFAWLVLAVEVALALWLALRKSPVQGPAARAASTSS